MTDDCYMTDESNRHLISLLISEVDVQIKM